MAFTLSPKQLGAIRRSTHALNIWSGSVSSGKTLAWIIMMLGEIETAGDVGALVIMGKTRDTIWQNVFDPIMTHPLFAGARPDISYRQGAPSARIFGRTVYVIGVNDIGAEEKIRGSTLQKVFYDELTLCPEPVFKMLWSRMRAPGQPVNPAPPRIFATTNPGSHNHYLKRDFIDRPDLTDTHVETFTMADNPGLSPDYIARMEASFSGVFYRRFILGMWVAAEGAIFEQFDPDTMVVDKLPPITSILSVGMDYGTNHPSAAYAIGMGEDQCLYAMAEWSPNPGETRLTDFLLADSLEAWLAELSLAPQYLFADPAAASFRTELFSRGIRTAAADNSVVNGINTINSLLVSGQLKIHTSCTHLLDELPEYRWDAKAAERGEDKPIKENDDHVDALRYAVYSARRLWQQALREVPHDRLLTANHL